MKKPTNPAILYLERAKLHYFTGEKDGEHVLNFNKDVINNCDVKNADLLNDQIRIFVNQNKIISGPFTTLLADDICQTKIFSEGTMDSQKTEVKKFIDLVPFENAQYNSVPWEKGFKFCVVNRDFYEIVEFSFEKIGFRAETTTPFPFLGLEKFELEKIYSKLNLARQNSFSVRADSLAANKAKEEMLTKNRRAIFLAGILLLLVIVLIVVAVITKKPTVKQIPLPEPVAKVEEVFDQPATKSAVVSVDQLTVKIKNASGVINAAGDLREVLKKLGFVEINIATDRTLASQSGLIYTEKVPAEILDLTLNKIKIGYPNIVVSQTASAEADLIFTIGRDQKKLPLDNF